MGEQGKDEALFKRIESLGLRLEYNSGFLVVTRSASDQRRDDDGEVEESLLEQLGNHLPDVARIAIGKARAARARAFLGQRVFVPSIKEFGRLMDCSADGIVRVSYRTTSFKDPERDVDLMHSVRGDEHLMIIASREPPVLNSKTSLFWITSEPLRRLNELLTRAAAAGIRLEHDSSFALVTLHPVQGVERKVIDGLITELGARLSEISPRLAAHERGERGADFVGKRVFVPDLSRFGKFVSCGDDGKVSITYCEKYTRSEMTGWVQGNLLLVVPDERERAAAEPASDQNSETRWQALMRRAFGG
jgi:hypothetical protein